MNNTHYNIIWTNPLKKDYKLTIKLPIIEFYSTRAVYFLLYPHS